MGRIARQSARVVVATISVSIGFAVAAGLTARPGAIAAVGIGGSVAGSWAGVLKGSSGSVAKERILITVNASEVSGSWTIGASCHGRLKLDSVSGGYHHYRRLPSHGPICAGGDVDCLTRVGPDVYDVVTPRPGGPAVRGTLRPA